MILNAQELAQLSEAILYLKMNQLKSVCEKLTLDSSGKKGELIERIITFLKTGNKITAPAMPAISKAKSGAHYPLAPHTFMLSGAYVNDLATRNFFKSLIGEHFHFTAYGIDWLNERWMAGKPPTYAEFADFWEAERLRRKKQKPNPKDEWAYINFLQDYYAKHSNASKTDATVAWKVKQREMVEKVMSILNLAQLPKG